MRTLQHPLASSALGTHRALTSLHFGPAANEGPGRKKVYIQASLHADELPGMLVAHHLRQHLARLESADKLLGEVVLVPVANPLGLAQSVLRTAQGRFDLVTGENFNRHYPALKDAVIERVGASLGSDAAANTANIRKAMRAALAAWPVTGELQSLRKTLLSLACDADIVLDLHCDTEAVVHLYTGTPLWPRVEPLARYLGAHATLLATESGDNPFDEACSQTWWQLGEHFGVGVPIELGCVAVTVELRGLAEVTHENAARDAEALLAYLAQQGFIGEAPPPLPDLIAPATPLAGSEALTAPMSGIVVFLRAPGERVRAGDAIVEIIDPLTAESVRVKASVDGVLYARDHQRYALTGARLAKIAGATAIRTGKLLSA
ncbi:MAG: succinylglutamate desuccinylase/aspartoacylase family protein [Betaproteobacteria bacterium]|nr:succinylglutamate desuccinylase/aspartoacylase family protein [Betaproteobacteria bacterium]